MNTEDQSYRARFKEQMKMFHQELICTALPAVVVLLRKSQSKEDHDTITEETALNMVSMGLKEPANFVASCCAGAAAIVELALERERADALAKSLNIFVDPMANGPSNQCASEWMDDAKKALADYDLSRQPCGD